MKKTIVLAATIIVATAGWAMAQHEHKHTGTTETKASAAQAPAQGEAKLADAGNRACPITGEKVSGKDLVTHKGVRYNLCCASCADTFLKDPDKYIRALKEKGEIK